LLIQLVPGLLPHGNRASDGLSSFARFLVCGSSGTPRPFAGASVVTRGEYLATSEKFSGRVESIEKLLIKMESQAEVDRHQNEILADHESRLRDIEHIPKS